MNLNVEKIPCHRIAYIRQVGPYGTGNAQTMEKLKNWSKKTVQRYRINI
ncbi:MAG: hypothetical protein Q8942_15365 [Bacillota bacterium]|nr:hypothetical protein [Bacillota bacterium]